MIKAQLFIFVLFTAITAGAASQVGVHLLDKATARQCQANDWPEELDRTHKDWCVDNGYKIN